MSAIYLSLALTCFGPPALGAPSADADMPTTLLGIDLDELEQITSQSPSPENYLDDDTDEDTVEAQAKQRALSRARRSGDDRLICRGELPVPVRVSQRIERPLSFHPANVSLTHLFCTLLC